MRRGLTVSALAAAIALIATACGSSSKSGDTATTTTSSPAAAIVWPAPPNPMELATQAGLVPENAERLEFHVHAHLDVFVNGQKVTVPAGLGIDITNPGVHEFPDTPKGSGDIAYGGIVPACNSACISPLHTHDVTGILHTESATRKYNTLGQLFTEWGVKLDENCVDTYCKPGTDITVYVNGKPRSGDPRTIPLTNYEEIAIVIGTPPQNIPSTGDFSQI
jgi:hypothetical protein